MILTLRTPRLLLRQPQMDDAEPISRYLNDFAVSGNLARVPFPYHLSDARAWLRTRLPNLPPEATNFAIDLPGEGLVGQVGFHQGPNGPIIGYWLGRPYWGRGIMTEAATALLDWHFSQADRDLVTSSAHHDNAASLAVQHKLGFVPTGREMRFSQTLQHNVDHVVTALSRHDWQLRGQA